MTDRGITLSSTEEEKIIQGPSLILVDRARIPEGGGPRLALLRRGGGPQSQLSLVAVGGMVEMEANRGHVSLL